MSIFLIAVGAILTFAVETTVSGIDINVVGIILMIVGGIGLLLSLFMMNSFRARRTVVHDGAVVRDERVVHQEPHAV
ncbi:MAG: DUF6458 family protein [Jiangellaceae bacterium]